MELKEFMKKENLSENDIIKAASIVTKVCDTWKCEKCPYYNYKICYAKGVKGDMVGIVKARIKELLHPSHMEKVAKLLGVKLEEKFIVDSGEGGNLEYILGEDGLHYSSLAFKDTFPELLQDLLIGKAYIVKKEEK